MSKLRKGDSVIVLAGKDKGRTGEVLELLTSANRILVSGVNQVKKCVRANPHQNEPGGIKTEERPINYSNVAILNPETNKADRIGFKFEEGRKIRVFKSNDQRIDDVE